MLSVATTARLLTLLNSISQTLQKRCTSSLANLGHQQIDGARSIHHEKIQKWAGLRSFQISWVSGRATRFSNSRGLGHPYPPLLSSPVNSPGKENSDENVAGVDRSKAVVTRTPAVCVVRCVVLMDHLAPVSALISCTIPTKLQ